MPFSLNIKRAWFSGWYRLAAIFATILTLFCYYYYDQDVNVLEKFDNVLL